MANKKVPCGGFEIDNKTIVEKDGVLSIGAMENIADSTAVDVAGIVKDFNDLLAALVEAGLMEAPTEP